MYLIKVERVQILDACRKRYPVWIYCCKRPNYDFWISQGSVATVLWRDGQN